MASGVAVDVYDNEHEPSSPIVSSDSDSANTATSRVYFGPVQPAEKRHIRPREPNQPTPIRRSTRSSAGSSAEPLQISTDGEGERIDASPNEVLASDQSRPDTPMLLEDALEEPSSALASKVLRAWDNPSPPPSPPLSSRASRTDVDVQLDDVDSTTPPLVLEADAATLSAVQGTPSAHAHADALPDRPAEAQADDMDLINFDSFTATSAPAVNLLPATPPKAPLGAPCSVDDLLAISPNRPSSGENPSPSLTHVTDALPNLFTPTAQEETQSADEEAQVLAALSPEQQQGLLPSSPPVVASLPEETIGQRVNEPSLAPAPQTPLRRSTRPRRSVSPYVHPTATPSKAERVPSPNPKVQIGPARRKRVRTKDQDVPQELSDSMDAVYVDSHVPMEDIQHTPDTALLDFLATPALDDIRSEASEEKEKRRESPLKDLPLRPLSPTSTNLLMQLLPSSSPKPDTGSTALAEAQHDNNRPPDAPSTPPPDNVTATLPPFCLEDQAPERPVTPMREDVSSHLRDVGRTPARRVPISEAIAQGTVSPVKAPVFFAPSQVNATNSTLGLPVFKSRAPEEILRSPAKRVPVADTMSSLQSPAKPATRPASPTKSSHVRSMSEDPIQPIVPKFRRSVSVEPVRPSPSILRPGELFRRPVSVQAATSKNSQYSTEPSSLAVPLNIPQPIQETDEAEPQQPSQPAQAKTDISKPPSGLRPPSSRADSKIPRPGVKPYTRPTSTSTSKPIPRAVPSLPKKTLPGASSISDAASTPAPTVARPMRMVRKVVSNKPPVEISSGSDDNIPPPVVGPGPRTATNRVVRPPAKPPSPSDDNGTPTLKRKRETDEMGPSQASPLGVKPIVLIRKVPPAPSRISKPATSSTASRQTSTRPSPAKSPGLVVVNGGLKLRKAVGRKKPESPARSPPPKPDSPMDVVPPSPPDQASAISQPTPSVPDSANKAQIEIIVDVASELAAQPGQSQSQLQDAQSQTSAPSGQASTDVQSETEGDASSHGLRRATRSRKAPATDVFGVVAPPRSAAAGRRRTLLLADSGAFSGMSALALKSLTNTNTQRNQQQVAEIQMEVVMKEGKRPDSPSTKVRSTLERQREDRMKQRQERAERRARRSSEGQGESEASAEEMADASLAATDVGEGEPQRHPRAPGDEEDYVTPERPAKRTRMDDGVEDPEAETKNERRVKWNRGLATTVLLDDTPPTPKRPPNDVPVKKGCLAPSAKARSLDTMGNVLNVDTPLLEVQPENVVVKKFVYEDDEPPVPEPSPAKATRSKSKKSRT